MKKEKKYYLIFGVVLLIAILSTSLLTAQFLYKTKISPYKDQIDTLSFEKDTLSSQKDNLQSQVKVQDSKLKDNEIFIEEYAIVLINIHRAMSFQDVSMRNLDIAIDYTKGVYYYDYAKPLYDKGKEQVLKAKDLLKKAKPKAEKIQNETSNPLIEEDIKNRLEQIDMLLSITDYR